MTFVQLTAQVKTYCRLSSNDAGLDQLVKDSINVAIFEIARLSHWGELLIPRHEPTMVGSNTGTPLVLPPRCMEVERIRFISASGNFWRLYPRTGSIPPAPEYGKPRAYEIVQGTPFKIIIEPYALIVEANDKVQVDYYEAPVLDADPISINWDSDIIKRASNYVMIYQNKVDQAKALWQTMLSQMSAPKTNDSRTT